MTRAAGPLAFAVCAIGCALAAGCAAPGEPTARHPVVPTPVTDLAAQQSGNSFVLQFTLPTKSMDREPLAERPSVEIYRATLAPGAAPDKKSPWRLAFTIPPEQIDRYLAGERVEFHDPLASRDVSNAAGTALAYKVRTREVRARDSADSNVVVARAYPPPEPPGGVQAEVMEHAIEISWSAPQRLPGAAAVCLSRVPGGSGAAGGRPGGRRKTFRQIAVRTARRNRGNAFRRRRFRIRPDLRLQRSRS